MRIKILIVLAILLLCQTIFGQRTVSIDVNGDLQGTTSRLLFEVNTNLLDAAISKRALSNLVGTTVTAINAFTNRGYAVFTNVTAGQSVPAAGYLKVFASNSTLYALSSAGVLTDLGGSGTGVTDGDKGDITISSSGATYTIDNAAVSLAKMANLSAPSKLIGRFGGGAGVPQEITISSGLSLDGSGNLTVNALADGVSLTNVNHFGLFTSVNMTNTGWFWNAGEFTNNGNAYLNGTLNVAQIATFSDDTVFNGGAAITVNGLAQFNGDVQFTGSTPWVLPDGIRQTFNPNGTSAGLNVGPHAGNPGTPVNGDLWYNSSTEAMMARINGVNVSLGSGSGVQTPWAADINGANNGATNVNRIEVNKAIHRGRSNILSAPHFDVVLAGPGHVVYTMTNNTVFNFVAPTTSTGSVSLLLQVGVTNAGTPFTMTLSNAFALGNLVLNSATQNFFTVTWDGTNTYVSSWQDFGIPSGTVDVALSTLGQMYLNETDEQLAIHSGSNGEISGEVAISLILTKSWTFDPKAVCDGAVDRLFLMWILDDAPEGIIIDEWKISFEADPTTEVDLDLKYADAMIGVANAVTVDALDTTAGAASEDTDANINSGNAIPNGKVLYLEFGTAYTEANHQIMFQIWYHVEED